MTTSRMALIFLVTAILAGMDLLGVCPVAAGETFHVDQGEWGTTALVGSMAWAIEQANTTDGEDTIAVKDGLEILVDFVVPDSTDRGWLARITESVVIQGNGAKLVGNPVIVTTDGSLGTKTNILGGAYEPALKPGDVASPPAFSFAQIGTDGEDNSLISVTISDLSADGLASFIQANDGSTLTVTKGSFVNMVNYTGSEVGRGVFAARPEATLNLSGISITNDFPFNPVVDVRPDAAVFFGTIQGEDSQLNLQNSSISDSYGAGAINWLGGNANIVSSVISSSGGLSIIDNETDGVLNFVNSILYLVGGEDLSQTNRIQAASGGEANILASSILYDSLFTSNTSGVAYDLNGMPLTATLDGLLNIESSSVIPLNTDLFFPGKDSYSEFSGGDLVAADNYSYIAATVAQNAEAVKDLFGNPNILTGGLAYNLIEFEEILEFRPLPGGAFPALDGVLVGAVPNAGSGGLNELINPINGQPILFDVFGNPRTRGGTRDIGAVQAIPEPSSLAIFGLLSVFMVGFYLVRQSKLKQRTSAVTPSRKALRCCDRSRRPVEACLSQVECHLRVL